jgi:hypothetical protein
MLIREISKQNIIEILILPLVFIMIFIAGIFLLVFLEIFDYVVYTSWCLFSGIIVIAIIAYFTYLKIKPKKREPLYYPPRYSPRYPPYRATKMAHTRKRKKPSQDYEIEFAEE